MNEQEMERARAIAEEVYRVLASRGGRKNTEVQRQARNENLKRARWKRWHPDEPYPEHQP